MSAVTEPGIGLRGAASPSSRRIINLGPLAIIWGVMFAIYMGLRAYQGMYAFEFGLDSTSEDFQKYWMTLLKVEVVFISVASVVTWIYLWVTRDKNLEKLDAETELRRYFNAVGWLLLYTFAFIFIASFNGEADATWHQTVVRDTVFTPSHIVLFYFAIPAYILFGVGSMLYAMTRLPKFANNFSVPLIMVVLGPGLILPNLGFNEWGHAFWLTEEIFTHPLHWGFVVLGWTGIGIGGLLLQVVMRMAELFKELSATQHAAAR
ncbi:MAG: bacterial ammonia monooxygenase, subunit AmoC [Burkholderiales bacterium]